MTIDVLVSIFVILGMVLTIILIGNTNTRPRVARRPEPDTRDFTRPTA